VLLALAMPALPALVPAWAHRLAFPAIAIFFGVDLWRTGQLLPAIVRLDLLLLLYRGVRPRAPDGGDGGLLGRRRAGAQAGRARGGPPLGRALELAPAVPEAARDLRLEDKRRGGRPLPRRHRAVGGDEVEAGVRRRDDRGERQDGGPRRAGSAGVDLLRGVGRKPVSPDTG